MIAVFAKHEGHCLPFFQQERRGNSIAKVRRPCGLLEQYNRAFDFRLVPTINGSVEFERKILRLEYNALMRLALLATAEFDNLSCVLILRIVYTVSSIVSKSK
jgi:hypothetical protein